MSESKPFEKMNWDEMREAVLVDYDTEIPNERAFRWSVRAATQIHVDMRPLTENLDLFRWRVRVPLLRRLAQTLNEENPGNVYYFREARFRAEAETGTDANAFMDRVNRRLAKAVVTLRTKTGNLAILEGLGFSYGLGINADDAEDALYGRPRGRTRTVATHYRHRTPDCLTEALKIIEGGGAWVSLHVPPRQYRRRRHRS